MTILFMPDAPTTATFDIRSGAAIPVEPPAPEPAPPQEASPEMIAKAQEQGRLEAERNAAVDTDEYSAALQWLRVNGARALPRMALRIAELESQMAEIRRMLSSLD